MPTSNEGGTTSLTPEDEAILTNYLNNSTTGGTDASTTHGPIPGLVFLGMGYDIFDRYASVDICKQNILDLSSEPTVEQQVIDASLQLQIIQQASNQIPTEIHLVYTSTVTVQYLPRFEVRSVNEFESTLTDQITKWSAHANLSANYGPFAGEIDARFSSTLAKLATTKCYLLVSKSTYWQLDRRYSLQHPAPLRKEVQEDPDNSSVKPREFFENYGTHYLSSVLIGCKVAVSSAIETSSVESDFDFASHLSATYGGKTADVGVTADATYQDKVKRFREHSKTSVFGVGIADEQLDRIKGGTEGGVSVLKRGWHNPSLIDFSANALKPIWTFCRDRDRRDAFQAAFDNVAAHRQSFVSGVPCILRCICTQRKLISMCLDLRVPLSRLSLTDCTTRPILRVPTTPAASHGRSRMTASRSSMSPQGERREPYPSINIGSGARLSAATRRAPGDPTMTMK
jgi:MAC/Perforin domain